MYGQEAGLFNVSQKKITTNFSTSTFIFNSKV